MRAQILSAKSVQEVERLLRQADDFRYARPDTERRIRRAAEQRKAELK